MSWRTLAVLALLVGGLVVLLRFQDTQREAAAQPEEALFPGLIPRAIHRIEVDHIERGRHLVLERDSQSRWYLVEPVAYPADDGYVRKLLELLAGTRGLIQGDAGDLDLGLDPPRVVVEFSAGPVEAGGQAFEGRLEVGADDVDGVRGFVRAGGRVLSVHRSLSNTLDLAAQDYRDRRATHLSASSVVSVRRSGSLVLAEGDEPTDLTLHALLEADAGWRSQAPALATLDPIQMGYLIRGAVELKVDGFADDAPADLARYGLDPPRLRVELEDERGRTVALRFGLPQEGPLRAEDARLWYACREGYPFVWTVGFRTVGLLSAPRQELYDTLLVRALREDVVGVDLGTVRLERKDDAWTVHGRPEAGVEGSYPADPRAVEDLLAAFEFGRVAYPDEASDFPAAGVVPLSIELWDGRRLGGELAPRGSGLAFRRLGDRLVGRPEGDLAALANTSLAQLRSPSVHRIVDWEVRRVRLGANGAEVVFERPEDRNVWSYADGADSPPEFALLRERLLHLAATRWLEGPGEPLEAPVEVELTGLFGSLSYRFGTPAGAGDDRVECRGEGIRAEVAPSLLADLRALLQ